jgi:hypothetical protein
MSPQNDLQLISLTLPATNPGGDPEESGSYRRKSQDIAQLSQRRPVADHGMLVAPGEQKLNTVRGHFFQSRGKNHAVYQKAI